MMLLYAPDDTPKGTEALLRVPKNGTKGGLLAFLPIPQIKTDSCIFRQVSLSPIPIQRKSGNQR